jgi:hypothetical protein
MLESGFRYLWQLGDGNVLITDDTVLRKIYTGYPYPNFGRPQDDLLYEFYCMHYKDYGEDYYYRNFRDEFIAKLKSRFSECTELTVLDFFYPDENKKFILHQRLGNFTLFVGKYFPKLETTSVETVVLSRTGDCYLLIPNMYIQQFINFIDLNTETNKDARNLVQTYSLPLTPDKVYIFSVGKAYDSWETILRESLEPRLQRYAIDFDFLLENRRFIFQSVPHKYVRDLSSKELDALYNAYVQKVRLHIKECYLSRLQKFPYTSRTFKFEKSNARLGIVLAPRYNFSEEIFDVNILEKLAPYFIKYKDGVAWLDAKRLFGDDCNICMSLLRTLNVRGIYKTKQKPAILKSFGIPDSAIAKAAMLSVGNPDSFLASSFNGVHFGLEGFYEFNVLVDSVKYVNSHIVSIESSELHKMYDEFKGSMNCTLDDFVKENFDYYKVAGKIIALSYNLTSLEVDSYCWASYGELRLIYKV